MCMRGSFLSVLLFLLTTGTLLAGNITPEETGKHVGEKITVRGTVIQVFVSKSNNIYLNFGANFPNQTFAAAALIQKTRPCSRMGLSGSRTSKARP